LGHVRPRTVGGGRENILPADATISLTFYPQQSTRDASETIKAFDSSDHHF
jgi:hypothetical protein